MDQARAIPDEELDLLVIAAVRATELARERRFVDGHEELLRGLRRASALAQCEAPAAWTPELMLRWRLAVERYCQDFGVQIP